MPATADAPAVTLNIGLFINAIINLLIVGFSVFLMVKAFNTAQERMSKKPEAPAPAAPPAPDPMLVQQQKLTEAIEALNKTMSAKS